MSHELSEDAEIGTLFAYDKTNGDPWHALGIPVNGNMTKEEALAALGILDERIYPIDLVDTEGEEADGIQAIKSSKFGHMGYRSSQYSIMTPSEIMDLAYEFLGLEEIDGRAYLDTIGRIGAKKEKFFASVRLPDITLDEGGIADVINRYLLVYTSFDGSTKNVLNPTDVRPVCRNTVEMGLKNLTNGITSIHTATAEARMRKAAEALEYIGAKEQAFVKRVEEMLRVDGDLAMNRIERHFYPLRDDMDDRVRTRREGKRELLHALYGREKDKQGPTGWAAYNAFIEERDHFLPLKMTEKTRGQAPDERKAMRAVFDRDIRKEKITAAGLVLA